MNDFVAILRRWLVIDRHGLTPEEVREGEAFIDHREATFFREVVKICIWFIALTPIGAFVIGAKAMLVLGSAHAFTTLVLLLWLYLTSLKVRSRPLFGWVVNAVLIGAYSYQVHQRLADPEPFSVQMFFGWTVVSYLMSFSVMQNMDRKGVSVFAALCVGASFATWSNIPDGPSVAGVTAMALIFSLLFRRVRTKLLWEEGRLERQYVAATVAERNAEIAHEVELARAIQDSMAPPAELAQPFCLVRCAGSPIGAVGGDWIAARVMPGGGAALLACAAEGEGFRAAIVLRVLQTLWAEALADERFDPSKWLARANQCLLVMSTREREAANAGILVLEEGRYRFWQAGDVFLRISSAGRDMTPALSASAMLGRGTPLVSSWSVGPAPPGTELVLATRKDGPTVVVQARLAHNDTTIVAA